MPSISRVRLTMGSYLIFLLLTIHFCRSTPLQTDTHSAKRVVRSADGEYDEFSKLCNYFCGYNHPLVGRSARKRFVHGRSADDQDFRWFDAADDLYDERFVHGKRFVHG